MPWALPRGDLGQSLDVGPAPPLLTDWNGPEPPELPVPPTKTAAGVPDETAIAFAKAPLDEPVMIVLVGWPPVLAQLPTVQLCVPTFHVIVSIFVELKANGAAAFAVRA